MRSAGVETTNEQKLAWLNEIGRMKRRVTYIRERPIDEYLRENTDYSRVDWAKISARDVCIFMTEYKDISIVHWHMFFF